ncbi:MAG: hypothetical protein VKJ04_08770 [Vampirovibrionales bacterium]|nr:hypothetical protein [Vampirovibrionales bacterium]
MSFISRSSFLAPLTILASLALLTALFTIFISPVLADDTVLPSMPEQLPPVEETVAPASPKTLGQSLEEKMREQKSNTQATSSPSSARPPSRLSMLSLNHDTIYLPTRLLLGENNRFVIKGKPGSQVMLYVSPKGKGYQLPNGLDLKIGETYESLGGTVPENGVLEINVPVPDEQSWEGHYLFVDAVSWASEDYGDLKQLQLMDSSGRRTSDNALMMMHQGTASNSPFIMPSMPGMPAGAVQQLSQTSQILGSNDERRKQLLDDGDRNTGSILDRNSFITRPGFQTSPLQQQ